MCVIGTNALKQQASINRQGHVALPNIADSQLEISVGPAVQAGQEQGENRAPCHMCMPRKKNMPAPLTPSRRSPSQP